MGNNNKFDFSPVSSACIFKSLDPYNSKTWVFLRKMLMNKSYLEQLFLPDKMKKKIGKNTRQVSSRRFTVQKRLNPINLKSKTCENTHFLSQSGAKRNGGRIRHPYEYSTYNTFPVFFRLFTRRVFFRKFDLI